jgi:hypothetical protein
MRADSAALCTRNTNVFVGVLTHYVGQYGFTVPPLPCLPDVYFFTPYGATIQMLYSLRQNLDVPCVYFGSLKVHCANVCFRPTSLAL